MCRSWEVRNLWMIDEGFFPPSAAMNPALTIAAQALRGVSGALRGHNRQVTEHCCEEMAYHLDWQCDMHSNEYECADALVTFIPKFGEYGLIIHDGGDSYVVISHCPWCGARLPESQRDRWFEEMERRGIDLSADDVPAEFDDDRWLRPEPDTSTPQQSLPDLRPEYQAPPVTSARIRSMIWFASAVVISMNSLQVTTLGRK